MSSCPRLKFVVLTFHFRKFASFVVEQNQKGHQDLDTRLEKSHMEVTSMRHDLQANGSLVQSNNSILTKLSSFVTGYDI